MQRESNLRIYIILAVTALSLYLILPTARYVNFSFTHKRPQAEADAKKYDDQKAKLQRGAISLGLDLVGGVDVLLKVDGDKTRARLLTNESEAILSRLREKRVGVKLVPTVEGGAKDSLTLTVDSKAETNQVVNAIRDYYEGANSPFEPIDEESFHKTGTAILKLNPRYFHTNMKKMAENARNTIEKRVDAFGVTQPSVSLQDVGDGMDGVRVQVPGERDPEYVISQLIRPAQLEFYLVDPKQMIDSSDPYQQSYTDEFFETKPWKDAHGKDITEFVQKKDLPPGCIAMKGEYDDPRSLTGKKTVMYIVKEPSAMTGQNLRSAYVSSDPSKLTNAIHVNISFDSQGASDFKQITEQNLRQHLAIALDGFIYSAPIIKAVIPNGQAVIEGSFSPKEAMALAQVLQSGALPADLKPDQKRTVGPTLGEQSLIQSMKAMAIAGVAITAFMVIYYGTAGIISVVALVLNLLLIIACLDLFNATLTLSGIGGIILTIGMAVDANVLIYERIRDELRSGRALHAAIRAGFARAFPVIFDSNLTTLLSAFVLLQLGEGSVRGFALTMVFGLIANLFTGLTVTYAIVSLWFRWRKSFGLGSLYIFRDPKIRFIDLRFVSFTVSGLVLLFALVGLTINGGPDFAVDFRGGVLSEVRVLGSAQDESQEITKILPGDQARVQRVMGVSNDYVIRLALQTPPGSKAGDTEYTQNVIKNALVNRYKQEGVEFLGATTVSTEVGQTFRSIALLVIIGASLAILIYLWFRFELVFGVAAVVALLHDLVCTIGIITLWKVQMSLDVVAALLVMVGFSVNDTIVIFDRIRENSHTMFGKSFKVICDDAMNKSMSRTIITSGTVVGVMIVMYLFGGASLVPFAKVMIVGGIIGTYSSDFIAAPLVFMWNQYKKGKLAKELGRKPISPIQSEEPALAGDSVPSGAATTGATAGAGNGGASGRRGRR
jgi:SecD/SecF fusion protein